MEGALTITGLCLAIAVSAITLWQLVLTFRKVQKVQGQVQEIHVLVNSQLTAVLARVTQLTGSLEKAGVDVPPRPPDASRARAEKHL